MTLKALKYILVILILLIFSLPARAGLFESTPIKDSDSETLNEADTTEVYNLLDTLSVQLGDEQAGLRLIEEKSLKDNLLDLVYGVIFRDTTNHNNSDYDDVVESEKRFRMYQGKIIAKIYLKKLPVFGGSVADSLLLEISDIEKFGNSMHINTHDWVIYNNLLFREGDRVQPFILADNERILRQLPFIRDARILALPEDDEERVDILVLTRDVFSLGVNFKFHSESDIAVSLFERNLLGNGWEFRNTFRHRSERDPALGYEGIFDVRNISGSFISGTLYYMKAYDILQTRLSFSKEYLTQETENAGGIDLMRSELNNELYNYDSVLYKSNTYDFWIGRSFQIGDIEKRNVFKLGIRYYQKNFEERPAVQADSNFAYHDQKLFLGNLIYNRLKYLTSYMIQGFGQTEDIPQGYALEFSGGFSTDEFKDRVYGGIQFWLASWFEGLGYLAFSSQVASFMYHKKAEDGLLRFDLTYFTPLIESGRYNFRHYFYGQYLKGFNRIDQQLTDIQDQNGIRGLSHEGLSGKEKLVLTFENRAFTPWSLSGFRFSLLSFADFGFVGDGHDLLTDQNFFSAIGLGCRIRNEGLVLQTINLQLAYYPKVPAGASHFGFIISLSEPFLFSQLQLGKPRVLTF
jgi:hypothetical protein